MKLILLRIPHVLYFIFVCPISKKKLMKIIGAGLGEKICDFVFYLLIIYLNYNFKKVFKL